MWIEKKEGSKFWVGILNELKNREFRILLEHGRLAYRISRRY
jgi:transposase-like protein